MFRTYREVLLPGERPSPCIGLPHHLTKDVGAVVDDTLEPLLALLVASSGKGSSSAWGGERSLM
jgi:hypothetical protein